MKQNPTIPAVLECATMALTNITSIPENKIIAGAAGAVQVHVSASTPLPMVLRPPPLWYVTPFSLWYSTTSLYGTPPLYVTPPLYMVLHPLSLWCTPPLYMVLPDIWYSPIYGT